MTRDRTRIRTRHTTTIAPLLMLLLTVNRQFLRRLFLTKRLMNRLSTLNHLCDGRDIVYHHRHLDSCQFLHQLQLLQVFKAHHPRFTPCLLRQQDSCLLLHPLRFKLLMVSLARSIHRLRMLQLPRLDMDRLRRAFQSQLPVSHQVFRLR